MPNAMTASALALLSLVGTTLGVHLGRSTIAQINPAYYSSPPPGHLYAELTPAGYHAAAGDQTSAEIWRDNARPIPLPDCVDCPDPSTIDRYTAPEAGSDATWQPSEPVPQIIRGIPQGQLERYMQFPVTQEEAVQQDHEKAARYAKRDSREEREPEAEPRPDGL